MTRTAIAESLPIQGGKAKRKRKKKESRPAIYLFLPFLIVMRNMKEWSSGEE